MSIDNKTRYIYRSNMSDPTLTHVEAGTYVEADCMSFIRNYKNNYELQFLVNKEMLHKNLTMEDVIRWIEIGNKLIFPATYDIVDVLESFEYFANGMFHKEIVRLRELSDDYPKYRRYDAAGLSVASIESINGYSHYENDKKHHTFSLSTIIKEVPDNCIFNTSIGNHWSIDSNDVILEKSGRVLYDEIIDDFLIKKEAWDRDNLKENYCITIKRNNAVSPDHFLSLLTFYRLLWSVYFKNIVRETLDLIDGGMDEWIALSYAYAKNYSRPYNGFSLKGYLFKDPLEIIALFVQKKHHQCYINPTFTDTNMNLDSITKETLNKYKKQKVNIKKVCVSAGRSKYLTVGKSYLTYVSGEKTYVLDDSNKFKETKKEKFE